MRPRFYKPSSPIVAIALSMGEAFTSWKGTKDTAHTREEMREMLTRATKVAMYPQSSGTVFALRDDGYGFANFAAPALDVIEAAAKSEKEARAIARACKAPTAQARGARL